MIHKVQLNVLSGGGNLSGLLQAKWHEARLVTANCAAPKENHRHQAVVITCIGRRASSDMTALLNVGKVK